jgi:hypothetical protein
MWPDQGTTVAIDRVGIAIQSSTNITHAYFHLSGQPTAQVLAFEIETPQGKGMYANLLLAYNKGSCKINFWAYSTANIVLTTG